MEEHAFVVDDLYRSLQDVSKSQSNKIDKQLNMVIWK